MKERGAQTMVQVKMDALKKIFNSGHAQKYDEKALQSKWLDPAIVFGMAYGFVNTGDSILDVGIGTGLSSELFFKAGLNVHGMDFSADMLSACASKQMTVDLKEHDLSCPPYPYEDNSIDHAVCTGVTHLFEDIGPVFCELSRIVRDKGIFAFVVADCDENENRVKEVKSQHQTGLKTVSIYSYSRTYIETLLGKNGFEPVYDLEFKASAIGRRPGRYRAWTTRRVV